MTTSPLANMCIYYDLLMTITPCIVLESKVNRMLILVSGVDGQFNVTIVSSPAGIPVSASYSQILKLQEQ